MVDQINELSKKILGSYIKQASRDSNWQSKKKSLRRLDGVARATDKLTKEDTEMPKLLDFIENSDAVSLKTAFDEKAIEKVAASLEDDKIEVAKLYFNTQPELTAEDVALEEELLADPTALSEKYEGFKKLSKELKDKGAKDPDGLAASIGKKKYGKKGFSSKKHCKEETVKEVYDNPGSLHAPDDNAPGGSPKYSHKFVKLFAKGKKSTPSGTDQVPGSSIASDKKKVTEFHEGVEPLDEKLVAPGSIEHMRHHLAGVHNNEIPQKSGYGGINTADFHGFLGDHHATKHYNVTRLGQVNSEGTSAPQNGLSHTKYHVHHKASNQVHKFLVHHGKDGLHVDHKGFVE